MVHPGGKKKSRDRRDFPLMPWSLHFESLREETKSRYLLEYRKFKRWYGDIGRRLKRQNKYGKAEVYALFVVWSYLQGNSRGGVEKCVSFLLMKHGPQDLVLAKRQLRGWKRLEPTQSREPVPERVAFGMAVQFCRTNRPLYALAVLLAFDTYMRIGEVLGLQNEDVIAKGDIRLSGFPSAVVGGVLIKVAKTGRNQMVTVRDDLTGKLLKWRKEQLRGDDGVPFFSFNYDSFRAAFKQVQWDMGFIMALWTPHGLRHGGALKDFLAGKPLLFIMIRGRWKVLESVRLYLQAGRGMLLRVQYPVPVRNQLLVWWDNKDVALGLEDLLGVFVSADAAASSSSSSLASLTLRS